MELPKKNFIIYDADCGFCQNSINRLKKFLGSNIEYVARQDLPDNFFNIGPKNQNGSIRFFEHSEFSSRQQEETIIHENYLSIYPNARIYSSAHAVFKALSYNNKFKILLRFYYYLPLFAIFAEAVYAVIARYRADLSKNLSCTIDSKQKG
jgi:predicted DCC family thiol-disulfide oxidoreductase YuxK